MDKRDIIDLFPLLAFDPGFSISSPEDDRYNCLAWAMMYKDRWVWPPVDEVGNPLPQDIDIYTWWPNDVAVGLHVKCLVEAFEKIGFEICASWEHEDGYVKVALYYDPQTMDMTHAARESRQNRCWMSKLGSNNDIHHSTPYTIEGELYGKVYCIMKGVG